MIFKALGIKALEPQLNSGLETIIVVYLSAVLLDLISPSPWWINYFLLA